MLVMDRPLMVGLHAQVDAFTARKVALYLVDQDVPDPYGGDQAAFTACAEIIEAGAARHLR
ncbi:hypothetical protein ACQB60_40995 [Actinomycetota bacterium Odt1-20B]